MTVRWYRHPRLLLLAADAATTSVLVFCTITGATRHGLLRAGAHMGRLPTTAALGLYFGLLKLCEIFSKLNDAVRDTVTYCSLRLMPRPDTKNIETYRCSTALLCDTTITITNWKHCSVRSLQRTVNRTCREPRATAVQIQFYHDWSNAGNTRSPAA